MSQSPVLMCAHRNLQQLLSHNATVYLAARSAQKANEAIAELKNETGKEAIFFSLICRIFMRSISQRRSSYRMFLFALCAVAKKKCVLFFRKENHLHVLINNA